MSDRSAHYLPGAVSETGDAEVGPRDTNNQQTTTGHTHASAAGGDAFSIIELQQSRSNSSPPRHGSEGGVNAFLPTSEGTLTITTTPATNMVDEEKGTEKPSASNLLSIAAPPSAANSHRGGNNGAVAVRVGKLVEHDTDADLLEAETRGAIAPKGFIHPNNPWLVYWSYLLTAISIYNCFTIPYRWTFWDYHVELSWDVVLIFCVDYFGDICFFLEMAKNFRLGFIEDGRVVWDPKRINACYFKSWFVMDILTCIPLDFIQLGYGRVIPAVRTLKMLRLFQILHNINFIENNQSVSLWFKLSKLLFYTGIIAHFAGCIKYPIMMDIPALAAILGNRTAFAKYLLTFYWSVGGLIDRGDVNSPITFSDYLLATLTMFVGVIWVANFVASMDQYTDSEDSTKKAHMADSKEVKKFMNHFKLPQQIKDKVKSYYSYKWGSPLRYQLDETLEKLPSALRLDIMTAFVSPTVRGCDFFKHVSPGFTSHIISKLEPVISVPGEMLCTLDRSGLEMYFIEEGSVEILVGSGKELSKVSTLQAGDYFGEYAFFYDVPRTASVRSATYCTLLKLSNEDLEEAFELFPAARDIISKVTDDKKAKTDLQQRNFVNMNSSNETQRGKLSKLVDTHKEDDAPAVAAPWTISHNHRFYIRWEAVHIAFTFYNSLLIPMRIAFAPDTTNGFILFLDYFGDLFFICDILLTFRVRFALNGQEISDVSVIRDNYLRGKFLLHVISSLPLDFFMIATGMQPYLRLNRVLRISHVHDIINGRIRDSGHPDFYNLLYLIANLVFLSHWFACMYWTLSRYEGFLALRDANGVVQIDPTTGEPVEVSGWQPSLASANEGDSLKDYISAQFWALGLLIGYGGAYFPPSIITTLFTLFIQFTGLFAVSYLIGVLGNTAGELQEAAAKSTEEIDTVTEAFNYRGVAASDPKLLVRLESYLKHTWSSQKGIDPNGALGRLPTQLRTEIMTHICGDVIRNVSRFKDMDHSFVDALAGELKFVEIPIGEYVFRQGTLGDAMFFIARGFCDIVFDDGSKEVLIKTIGSSSFFGEGALFSGVRSASVKCRTPVLLFSLSTDSFTQVMHMFPKFADSVMSTHETRHQALVNRADLKIKTGTPQATHREVSQKSSKNGAGDTPQSPTDGTSGASTERRDASMMSPLTGKRTQLAEAAQALLRKHQKHEETKAGSTRVSAFKRIVSHVVQNNQATGESILPATAPAPGSTTNTVKPLTAAFLSAAAASKSPVEGSHDPGAPSVTPISVVSPGAASLAPSPIVGAPPVTASSSATSTPPAATAASSSTAAATSSPKRAVIPRIPSDDDDLSSDTSDDDDTSTEGGSVAGSSMPVAIRLESRPEGVPATPAAAALTVAAPAK